MSTTPAQTTRTFDRPTTHLPTLAEIEAEIVKIWRRVAQLDADEVAADTIVEFCRRHRISRAFYYVLRGQGRGPARCD
jgi:hypothetical protein